MSVYDRSWHRRERIASVLIYVSLVAYAGIRAAFG